MSDVLDVRLPRRALGRPALVRRLRGLVIAAHRFARHRAITPADRDWAIRVLDGLAVVLREADPAGAPRPADTERRPPA